MDKYARIGFLNAQGFPSKKNILLSTATELKLSVLCLAETWLRPSATLSLPELHCFSRPRPILTGRYQARGGVAILVHHSLPATPFALPPALQVYETVAAEVSFPTTGKIVFLSAYFPPGEDIPAEFLRFVSSLPKAILCGDLNARHQELDDHESNAAGRQLKAQLDAFPSLHRISVPIPSCHTHVGFSNPDHIIITSSLIPALCGPVNVQDALHTGSDHDLLLAEFDIAVPERLRRRTFRKFGEEEQKKFADILRTKPIPVAPMNKQDLDKAADLLVSDLADAYLQSSVELRVPDRKPALPAKLLEIISDARRIRKKIRKNRRLGIPVDPRTRTLLNHLKAKIKRGVIRARQDSWVSKISTLHPKQGGKFWKTLRSLAGQRSPDHPLVVNNNTIATPVEKAAAFADSLNLVFQINNSPEFDRHRHYASAENTAREWLASPTENIADDDPVLRPISHEEVLSVICGRKTNSAPGKDKVSWKSLKAAPRNILISISVLLTGILRLQHWPKSLKTGVFVMIPKPGRNPRNPDNWRPICLLPTISKILEGILSSRIARLIEDSHRLPRSQHGFRHSRGTNTALLRLLATITTQFMRRNTCSALFLDINRAFDTVPHLLLLFKLRSVHQLSVPVIQLIHSFLNNRSCTVRVASTHSNEFTPQSGVPQGSPLSPLLYNLYAADIPTGEAPFKQEYADDSMFLVTGVDTFTTCRKLETTVVPALTNWMKKWKIAPNPTKTVLVHFRGATQGLQQEDKARGIEFWNHQIQPSLEVKYLGILLTHTLNFKKHFVLMKRKARQREAVLKILRGPKFRAQPNILSGVYKSLIRPLLTYAIPALGSLSAELMTLITQGDRRLLRLAVGLPFDFPSAFLYERAQCEDFESTANNHRLRLIKKIISSDEDYIQDIVTGPRRRRRREKYTHPVSYLLSLLRDAEPATPIPRLFQPLLRFN